MRNVAVLIDAENVQASFADKIFTYANSIGMILTKEIYGVSSALGLWVEPVLKYAIHSNLTIKASKFKNTSDISLVIGAMDLLIAGSVDTVIIVSSDSDFSTLSIRLRSSGIEVIGMGTEKANPLWRTACSSFVILTSQSQNRTTSQSAKPIVVQPAPQPIRPVKTTVISVPPQMQKTAAAPVVTVAQPPVQTAPAAQSQQPKQASAAAQNQPQQAKSEPAQQPEPVQEPVQPKQTIAEQNQAPELKQAPSNQQQAERAAEQTVEPEKKSDKKADKKKESSAPVILIPDGKVSNPPAVSQPKASKPKAAATHAERANAIRTFITRQLQMNGGRMGIPNIFHALNNLPDYHVDQQGSKRKPLNYLMWMFGDSFSFEDGYISLPKDAKDKAENDTPKPSDDRQESSAGQEMAVSGQTGNTESPKAGTSTDGKTDEEEKAIKSSGKGKEKQKSKSSGTEVTLSVMDAETQTGKLAETEKDVKPADMEGEKPETKQTETEKDVKLAATDSEKLEIKLDETTVKSGNDAAAETAENAQNNAMPDAAEETETGADKASSARDESEADSRSSAQPVMAEGDEKEQAENRDESTADGQKASDEAIEQKQPEGRQEDETLRSMETEASEEKGPAKTTEMSADGQSDGNGVEKSEQGQQSKPKAEQTKQGKNKKKSAKKGKGSKEEKSESESVQTQKNDSTAENAEAEKPETEAERKTEMTNKASEVPEASNLQKNEPVQDAPVMENVAEKPENGEPTETAKKAEKPAKSKKNTAKKDVKKQQDSNSLASISLSTIGIQTKPVSILRELGYSTLADVEQVSNEDLMKIKGIGKATVDQIRAAIQNAQQ